MRTLLILIINAALLNMTAAVAFASNARTSANDAGEVNVAGSVTVDGVRAVSGQTFFSGSTVATAGESSSALSLGNLARLELSAESALKLDFTSANVGGVLEAGRVRVFVPAGLAARFETAGAHVSTDASRPAVFSVAVEKGRTVVAVERGRVEMSAGGEARTFAAGEVFAASAGSPPEPRAAQDQDQDDDRKGLWAGVVIAASIAVLIVAVTGRQDEEEFDFGTCIGGISDSGGTQCF